MRLCKSSSRVCDDLSEPGDHSDLSRPSHSDSRAVCDGRRCRLGPSCDDGHQSNNVDGLDWREISQHIDGGKWSMSSQALSQMVHVLPILMTLSCSPSLSM